MTRWLPSIRKGSWSGISIDDEHDVQGRYVTIEWLGYQVEFNVGTLD